MKFHLQFECIHLNDCLIYHAKNWYNVNVIIIDNNKAQENINFFFKVLSFKFCLVCRYFDKFIFKFNNKNKQTEVNINFRKN